MLQRLSVTIWSSLFFIIIISPAMARKAAPFQDDFDKFDNRIWQELPTGAVVKDGVLTEKGIGAINVISRKSFKYGTFEAKVRFNALTDPIHYYLGFFKTVPWGESSAWCMIQGNVVNFRVGNKQAADNVAHCDLSPGQWYDFKMVWSTDRAVFYLDDKLVGETRDPKLLPSAPLQAVAMTLSEDQKQEANMEVDWIKVSDGDGQASSDATARKAVAGGPSVKLESNSFLQQISLAQGATWGKLASRPGGVDCLAAGLESLMFVIVADGNPITSTEMKLEDHSIRSEGRNKVLRIVLSSENPALLAELSCQWGESDEGVWSLKVTNRSAKPVKIKTIFPLLENVRVGDKLEDNYYFYPYMGGWCGKLACSLGADYPGVDWMQMMCVYNPDVGRGLYVYSKDSTGSFKGIVLKKASVASDEPVMKRQDMWLPLAYPEYEFNDDNDITLAMYYLEKELTPGSSFSPPDVAIGIYQGDWHQPLKRYSDWVHTWYKRQTTTPQWFKDCFNFVSWHPPSYYSEEQKKYVASEKLIGSEDIFQWAFWWDYPPRKDFYPRMNSWPGDYDYNQVRGGLPTFKEEIKKIQEKGTRFTVYINMRFNWYKTKIGEAHGKEWARMDQPGRYCMDFLDPGEGWNECIYCEGWQDHLIETCGRVVRDTGMNGIYLDEMAFLHPCYNPAHPHYQKGSPYSTEMYVRLMKGATQAMRKWNPEAILMGEHAGSEYYSQFFDGSWSQQYSHLAYPSAIEVYDDYNINFFRFCIPEFKIAEFGQSDLRSIKRCFFSGIGICWDGSNQDVLRVYGQTFKENGDAFASLKPKPIIKTRKANLFANKFPIESKVIYTLYNKTGGKVDRSIIEVDRREGYHYVELLNDLAVVAKPSGEKDIIDLPLESQEVACLAQLPNIIEVTARGRQNILDIALNPARLHRLKYNLNDLHLIVFSEKDDSYLLQNKGKQVKIKGNRASVDLHLFPKSRKLILKLVRGNKLVDELVLPVSS